MFRILLNRKVTPKLETLYLNNPTKILSLSVSSVKMVMFLYIDLLDDKKKKLSFVHFLLISISFYFCPTPFFCFHFYLADEHVKVELHVFTQKLFRNFFGNFMQRTFFNSYWPRGSIHVEVRPHYLNTKNSKNFLF